MSDNCGRRDYGNNLWWVEEDSSVPSTSPVYRLKHPVVGLGFQFSWDNGVLGKWTFEATINGVDWEPLVACNEITVDASPNHFSEIVAIKDAWLLASSLRIQWVPLAGSTGGFSVALRVLPL